MKFKKILKASKPIWRFPAILYKSYLGHKRPKKLANLLYRYAFGRGINWEIPQEFNEKINWLKFNSDTSAWTKLADKYLVREFVKKRLDSDSILPKLYGVWNSADEVDFEKMPNQFVLKSNNGCGTVLLVKDKSKLNIKATKKILRKWLKSVYGYTTAEPHYVTIPPLIIAEELLINKTNPDKSIVDYKFYCFDGNPYMVLVCTDRVISKNTKKEAYYDMNWNLKPKALNQNVAKNEMTPIDKPLCFEEMKEVASKLSKGFPQVRVDLYEVDGKTYFGELTFTSMGGYDNEISSDELKIMGNLINLPNKPI